MSLLKLQKAERRAGILSAAQRLMARRGWKGLTMRDLAEESHVSVPTVYNLVGGKGAVLAALMEDLFELVSETGTATEGDVVSRARALWNAGLDRFLDAPQYARELVLVFLSSRCSSELGRHHDARYVELMATVLAEGQERGELRKLVAPSALAETMYSLWIAQTIRWARGDIDDAQLRAAVDRGLSLLLLGMVQGQMRMDLERSLEAAIAAPEFVAAGRKGAA